MSSRVFPVPQETSLPLSPVLHPMRLTSEAPTLFPMSLWVPAQFSQQEAAARICGGRRHLTQQVNIKGNGSAIQFLGGFVFNFFLQVYYCLCCLLYSQLFSPCQLRWSMSVPPERMLILIYGPCSHSQGWGKLAQARWIFSERERPVLHTFLSRLYTRSINRSCFNFYKARKGPGPY